MAKREYDDNRYLEWREEVQKLLYEFLNTEGNSRSSLEAELQGIVIDLEEDDE